MEGWEGHIWTNELLAEELLPMKHFSEELSDILYAGRIILAEIIWHMAFFANIYFDHFCKLNDIIF